MFKVNNKDTRMTSAPTPQNDQTHSNNSSASIVKFEQVNAGWEII